MTTPEITFFVAGSPKTQGSKHGFAIKKGGQYTGKVIMVDSCKGLQTWRQDVRTEAAKYWPFPPHAGPVSVMINFKFNRPKSHFGTGSKALILKLSAPIDHVTKPDLTKLSRAVEDALKGLVWRDDSQICNELTTKKYLDENAVEGASVTIKFN